MLNFYIPVFLGLIGIVLCFVAMFQEIWLACFFSMGVTVCACLGGICLVLAEWLEGEIR